MKKKSLFSKVLTVLLVSAIIFGSTTTSFAVDNVAAKQVEEVEVEGLDSLLDDFIGNNLKGNAFYLKTQKEINGLKVKYGEDLKKLESRKDLVGKHFFETNISFEEFVQKDKEYLKNISVGKTEKDVKDILQTERTVLSSLLELSEKYFLKTNLGAKLYPVFISERAMMYQSARFNRKQLISGDFNDYDTKFYTLKYSDDGDDITEELSDSNIEGIFITSLYLFNNMPIKKEFVNSLSVFISPYQLEDENAYALTYSESKVSKNELIVLALKLDASILKSKSGINQLLKVNLHELGHVVDQRSNALKVDQESISDIYYNLDFSNDRSILNSLSSQDYDYQEWAKSLRENFAEDFAVFMGDKMVDGGLKIQKKTPYIYNTEIKNLLEKTID